MNKFYVYVLMDPRVPGPFKYGRWKFSHKPFYVGKGQGLRYSQHSSFLEKPYKKATADRNRAKRGLLKAIHAANLSALVCLKKVDVSEDVAFAYEIQLIEIIGRLDLDEGPLTNLTDGGDGGSGHRQGKALRKRRSSLTKAWWDSASKEDRESRAARMKATKADWSDSKRDSVKANISKTRSFTQSPRWKKKVSESVKEHFNKPGVREQHSATCKVAQTDRWAQVNQPKLTAGAKSLGIKVLEPYQGSSTKLAHQCLTCKHEWSRLPFYTINTKCGCPKCGLYKNKQKTPGRKWYHNPKTLESFQLYPTDPRVKRLSFGRTP